VIQSVAKGSVHSRMPVGLSVVMPWLSEVGMPKVMPKAGGKVGMPTGAEVWGQFGSRIRMLGCVSGCAMTAWLCSQMSK
jgi:hypothetical protein